MQVWMVPKALSTRTFFSLEKPKTIFVFTSFFTSLDRFIYINLYIYIKESRLEKN